MRQWLQQTWRTSLRCGVRDTTCALGDQRKHPHHRENQRREADAAQRRAGRTRERRSYNLGRLRMATVPRSVRVRMRGSTRRIGTGSRRTGPVDRVIILAIDKLVVGLPPVHVLGLVRISTSSILSAAVKVPVAHDTSYGNALDAAHHSPCPEPSGQRGPREPRSASICSPLD